METTKELIKNFSSVRVLIIGDVMLDRYWWGSVSRISPEAPVPVVKLEKTSVAAGGAANVAANVVGLGAEAVLIGIVGNDAEARDLSDILERSKISSQFLVAIENHRTTVKTRIVAHSQQIVRLDQEKTESISDKEADLVFGKIEETLEGVDIVIISDYAKGFLTENLLARLLAHCIEKNKKVLVDPKGKDYSKYQGATILTPNRKEAIDACKFEDHESDLINKAGKRLLETISIDGVLITHGEKGMTLFEKNGDVSNFDALARNVYDVTGAGDTVIATLAVAIASGLNYREASKLANIAAGLVVEQIGTTAIDVKNLKKSIDENENED